MSQPAAPEVAFPPVRRSVTVKAGPETAFYRFTREIASWWPLPSHSIGGRDAESVAIEERVGGRILERIRGGRECVWGTVTAWDPPRRVAFTWHPGHDPEQAQDVEVRFTGVGSTTRVELVHRGFERLGAQARLARRAYPMGWTYVLGRYARRRDPGMMLLTGLTSVLMAIQRLKGSAAAEKAA
jgi:uncharacterized protein YndB with AHSA1/START domain